MIQRVLDIDHGWDRIRKELEATKGAYVKVGVLQDAKREDASPMVVVAAAHEFGTEDNHPPERSWLRSTHDEQRANIAKLMKAELLAILGGHSTAPRSLALIGEWFQGKVKAKIRSGIAPALAESTKARRAAPDPAHVGPRVFVPLIDTAQFIESIRYLVVLAKSNLKRALP